MNLTQLRHLKTIQTGKENTPTVDGDVIEGELVTDDEETFEAAIEEEDFFEAIDLLEECEHRIDAMLDQGTFDWVALQALHTRVRDFLDQYLVTAGEEDKESA